MLGFIQRLWLGYDPDTSYVCEECRREFTGRRYAGPPKPRHLDMTEQDRGSTGFKWRVLCPECASRYPWAGTPPRMQ